MKEIKVSKRDTLVVLAKLRAGTSSVKAEAQRLGVYHATLRKQMRATIGSKQYDKLFSQRRGRALGRSEVLSVIARIKAGNLMTAECKVLGVSHSRLNRLIVAAIGAKEYAKLVRPLTQAVTTAPATRSPRKRYERSAPTFSHVVGDFCCGRCGSDRLKPGTDGNGRGVLWCACGWSTTIPRVRVTTSERSDSTTVARNSESNHHQLCVFCEDH